MSRRRSQSFSKQGQQQLRQKIDRQSADGGAGLAQGVVYETLIFRSLLSTRWRFSSAPALKSASEETQRPLSPPKVRPPKERGDQAQGHGRTLKERASASQLSGGSDRPAVPSRTSSSGPNPQAAFRPGTPIDDKKDVTHERNSSGPRRRKGLMSIKVRQREVPDIGGVGPTSTPGTTSGPAKPKPKPTSSKQPQRTSRGAVSERVTPCKQGLAVTIPDSDPGTSAKPEHLTTAESAAEACLPLKVRAKRDISGEGAAVAKAEVSPTAKPKPLSGAVLLPRTNALRTRDSAAPREEISKTGHPARSKSQTAPLPVTPGSPIKSESAGKPESLARSASSAKTDLQSKQRSPEKAKQPAKPDAQKKAGPWQKKKPPVTSKPCPSPPTNNPVTFPISKKPKGAKCVKFGETTIHTIEVHPGRHLTPIGPKQFKTKSGLSYINAPADTKEGRKLVVEFPPGKVARLRRHRERQAAMARYWLRTEEEEAAERAEAVRRAEETTAKYREEPSSPCPGSPGLEGLSLEIAGFESPGSEKDYVGGLEPECVDKAAAGEVKGEQSDANEPQVTGGQGSTCGTIGPGQELGLSVPEPVSAGEEAATVKRGEHASESEKVDFKIEKLNQEPLGEPATCGVIIDPISDVCMELVDWLVEETSLLIDGC